MTILSSLKQQTWGMAPDALRALEAEASALVALVAAGLRQSDPKAALSPSAVRDVVWNGGNPLTAEINGDTATIEIIGPLVARAPWFAKAYMGTVDPYDIADAVDALVSNAAVKRLIVEIDSGGGTTSGTAEAAAAITRFQSAGKTVEVRASGMLASAAYWLAAGADKITASPTAQIGYLGTIIALCDDTQAMAQSGMRMEIIASTPAKAACMDPAISQIQRDAAQRRVDAITAVFRDAVSAGRGITGPALDAVFTGGGWIASEALALGLIDAVSSPADAPEKPSGNSAAPDPVLAPIGGDSGESSSASITPAASQAATSSPESSMDTKLKAKLAALCQTHPTHAAEIVAAAMQDGATEATLDAHVSALVVKAKDEAHAAEIAAMQAKLDAAEKATADANAKAEKAEKAHAAIKAHLPGYKDPGGDDQAQPAKPTSRAKMSADEKGEFIAKNGQAAYLALPE